MKKIIIIFIGFALGVTVTQNIIVTTVKKNTYPPTESTLNRPEYGLKFLENERARGYIEEVNTEERSIIFSRMDLYTLGSLYKTKVFYDEHTRFYEFSIKDNYKTTQVTERLLEKITRGDAVAVRYYKPDNSDLYVTALSLRTTD
ncbi:MAG: hypothetical protein WD509_00870 [Candidatus Paceibacterota bacterium]